MKLQIRQERIKRDWTLEFIAQKIGLTTSTVSDIEKGRCKPSFDVLVKLLNLFGYKKTAKTIVNLFSVVNDTHNLSTK